jgi:hypothetical protein
VLLAESLSLQMMKSDDNMILRFMITIMEFGPFGFKTLVGSVRACRGVLGLMMWPWVVFL